jgi:MFS family permease
VSLAVRRGVLALLALLIAEAVWIVTVPPFRGSDEVDHAYRAAGVASGQIHLSHGAAHGRGLLVWVPTDIVTSAQKQCTSLSYVGRDNCHPVETSGGRSLVATAAGAYDPLYYAFVGTMAKPFHGAAADYAMRVASALLCALLLALGVGLMTFAGTGPWTNLGVLAAITPEVLFSGAMPSPNGVEMGLAFVLWAALLGAVRRGDDVVLQRRLLAVAGMAIFPLTFIRLLGPMWVVLIVGAVIATIGWREAKTIARRHRRVVATIAAVTVVGVCWWAAWQVIASHATGVQPDVDRKKWILAFNLPVYTMQMVGAFPWRDEPAPLAIYPLVFFVILLMLVAAWRRGATARVRRAVFWIGITSLLIPVVLSLVFMPSAGAVWQGRYEVPFVIGILPLCGLILDDVGFAPAEGRRLIGLSGIFLVVAQLACVYHVQQLELGRSESYTDPAWWHPPGVMLAVLMLVACAVAWPLMRDRTPTRVDEPEPSLT